MKTFLVTITLLVLALAGCAKPPAEQAGDRWPSVPVLAFDGDKVLASIASHRMSEFYPATDPNDPDHLLIGAMDWDADGRAGTTACQTFQSRDGGRRWTPGHVVPGLDVPRLHGDPWVTIDAQGRGHLVCMQFNNDPERLEGEVAQADTEPAHAQLYFSRSDDGGQLWSNAKRVPTPKMNEVDKDSILSLRSGTLVNCIYETNSGLTVERSVDGGATWTAQIVPDVVSCFGIAEGPGGEVYINTFDGTITSFDDGLTWGPHVRFNPRYPIREANGNLTDAIPAPGSPVIAASPTTGKVVFVSPRSNGEDKPWTFVISRSTDRASTFTDVPFDLPVSATCKECHANFPLITYDPQGRLALQFARMSPYAMHREIWMMASADDGSTWSPPVQVSATDNHYDNVTLYQPRDPDSAFGTATYYGFHPTDASSYSWQLVLYGVRDDHLRWGGDYWGITYSDAGFVAMWIEHDAEGTPGVYARRVNVS